MEKRILIISSAVFAGVLTAGLAGPSLAPSVGFDAISSLAGRRDEPAVHSTSVAETATAPVSGPGDGSTLVAASPPATPTVSGRRALPGRERDEHAERGERSRGRDHDDDDGHDEDDD